MNLTRPDLSQIDPAVRAYIESLEAEIDLLRQGEREPSPSEAGLAPLEPSEPPTTINLITATFTGIAKRTPRHLYSRQRRGGMGVFDLEIREDDPPGILALADESQSLLLITNLGRAFRLPVSAISETPVRGRGESILGKLNLATGEHLGGILPIQAQGYLATVSQSGMVRTLRHHIFGEYMKPGTALYDIKTFGPLAAACWTPGDGDLFIATRKGRGIRFAEKLVPPQGCLGIRLAEDDRAVAIAPVYEDSGVFLLAEDGKGTVRAMAGFNPNKAPGAGGKIALATEALIAAANVDDAEDLFIISGLSKIIRFMADEVPAKEGVVQGVNCMSFRSDEAAALAVSARDSLL